MTTSTDQSIRDKQRQERNLAIVQDGLAKRHAAEKRFRLFGVIAILASLSFLALLLSSIVIRGMPAFTSGYLTLNVNLDPTELGINAEADPESFRGQAFDGAVKAALREHFPNVDSRRDKRELYALVSSDAGFELGRHLANHPQHIGSTVPVRFLADDEAAALIKDSGAITDDPIDSIRTRLSEQQIGWLRTLHREGATETAFNRHFFTQGDSREPEQAGIRAALLGSAYTLLVTFLLSFPIAVAAAIYLEEFAPQNRLTDLIEININNLAAVPSIVFGLLGLAMLINFMHLPRSAPLVGGIVLSLMTLPTIIISSRAALKSVPPSIRDAATGLGASKVQVIVHHVLPLAMPGILTGTIIGLAQALGETAPLLMIGMVAFIVDVPQGFTDPSTVLPVQVYLWADSPERAFTERTSAAILVLLTFLVCMNALAVMLRRRFERRW